MSSAWLHTTAELTSKKKTDLAFLRCAYEFIGSD